MKKTIMALMLAMMLAVVGASAYNYYENYSLNLSMVNYFDEFNRSDGNATGSGMTYGSATWLFGGEIFSETMQLDDNYTNSGISIMSPDTYYNTTQVLEFDWNRVEFMNYNSSLELFLGQNISNPTAYFELYFLHESNGTDGSIVCDTNSTTYYENTWYHMKIVIDKDNLLISVYNDGSPVCENISYTESVGDTDFWAVFGSTGAYESVAQFDNVVNYNGSETPYYIPCTPNWVCGGYDSCQLNHTQVCNNATDLNSCGESYGGDLSEFTDSCYYCPNNTICSINQSALAIYDSFTRSTTCWDLGSADTNQTWWYDSYGGGVDCVNNYQYVDGETFVAYFNDTWYSIPTTGNDGISMNPGNETLTTYEWDYKEINNGTISNGFFSIDYNYLGGMFTIGHTAQNPNGSLDCYSPSSGYYGPTSFVFNDGEWHHFKAIVNVTGASPTSEYWAYMDDQLICSMNYSGWGDVLGAQGGNGDISLQFFLLGDSDNYSRTQLVDDLVGYLGDISPYIITCIPLWNCSLFGNCTANVSECLAVTDLNVCGEMFTGNLSDYDEPCVVPPITGYVPAYETGDLPELTIDLFAQALLELVALVGVVVLVVVTIYAVKQVKKIKLR